VTADPLLGRLDPQEHVVSHHGGRILERVLSRSGFRMNRTGSMGAPVEADLAVPTESGRCSRAQSVILLWCLKPD
jgi:hypothetical protein